MNSESVEPLDDPLLLQSNLEDRSLRAAPHLVADGGSLGEGVEPLLVGEKDCFDVVGVVQIVVRPFDFEGEIEREHVGLVASNLGGEIGRALTEAERAGPRDHLLDAPLRPLRTERRHERIRKHRDRDRRVGQRTNLIANGGERGGFESGRAKRWVSDFDLGEQGREIEGRGVGSLGVGTAESGEPEGAG